MLGVRNKMRKKSIVNSIRGDLRGGTAVTLWTVVAPCGRWSHLVESDRTLWKVITPCGRWSHLVDGGRTLWTVVSPCGR